MLTRLAAVALLIEPLCVGGAVHGRGLLQIGAAALFLLLQRLHCLFLLRLARLPFLLARQALLLALLFIQCAARGLVRGLGLLVGSQRLEYLRRRVRHARGRGVWRNFAVKFFIVDVDVRGARRTRLRRRGLALRLIAEKLFDVVQQRVDLALVRLARGFRHRVLPPFRLNLTFYYTVLRSFCKAVRMV